jgi:SAM-dependent methyltransferase
MSGTFVRSGEPDGSPPQTRRRQTEGVDPFARESIGAAYDAVAADYLEAFGNDLDQLPLDRGMLEAADTAADPGAVLDVGCGPGAVGAALAARGRRVVGLDLSGAMLGLAASRLGLAAVQADMCAVPAVEGAFTLAVAYYCVQHLRRDRVSEVLEELHRVLRPGGVALVATHLGEGEASTSEFLGHEIATIAGALYPREEIEERMTAAGFDVESVRERGPLPHEYPSRRIYLLARRREPGSGRGGTVQSGTKP